MPRWTKFLLVACGIVSVLLSAGAFTFSVAGYHHTVTAIAAPVYQVVQTDDVDLLTAKLVIGDTQIELRNLITLYEKQAALFGLTMDRLVQEIRENH